MESIYGLNIYLFLIAGIVLTVFAFSVYKLTRRGAKKSVESAVQDFTGKFERRHYRFHNGLECYQEQLTLEQTEELAVLLSEVNLSSNADFTLEMLTGALFTKKGLRRALEIALVSTNGDDLQAKVAQLTQDEVEAVLNDFFTLNPKMKLSFEIIKLAVASQEMKEASSLAGDSKTAQPAH